MPTRATLEFLEENGIPETTTKPPTTANAAEQDRKEQEKPYNGIESKIWGEIKPFEEVTPHEKFNLNLLPDKMGEYVQAVSDYTDTAPEMGILPLFSVLALCLQGKAVVKHPANSHTEPLNLYTLTIAAPGERKSSIFKCYKNPIDEYQYSYNETHKKEISDYTAKKKFLENQLSRELKSKNGSLATVQQLQNDIDNLPPKINKKFYLTDTTPEALARELLLHDERMGILGDESTILNILSGIYNKQGTNFDIILTCYDGASYSLSRQTSNDISLKSPLLTIGTMIQPKPFFEVINNKNFSGKGLMQRFLFAFPESRAGKRKFYTPDIPEHLQKYYNETVTTLLQRAEKFKTIPTLQFNKSAENVLRDYFYSVQSNEKTGMPFENLTEYEEKQVGKVMRLAGIMHLLEHSEKEKIDEKTALNATLMGNWFESQALRAYGIIAETPETRTAKYICRRLKERLKEDRKLEYTKRDVLRLCGNDYKADTVTPALELLDEMCIIKYIRDKNNTRGRTLERILVNPKLKDSRINC